MKLRYSARTDVGKTRDHNEDSYGVGGGEQAERMGELLVVCDGMGGHAAGEVASQIGVETILSIYYGDTSEDRPHALEQAFEEANEQIFARGHGSMGTTGVAALIHHDALHVANVGDSRAYLIREGEIRQVSRDHSFVSDQVAAGLITADQARASPHRNVITRALGYQSGVSVDLFRLPLQIGDIIVLCSDGLHGLVSDAEIADIAAAAPEQAVQQLVDLANSRGGNDNITVAIAHIEALDWYGGEATVEDDAHERVTAELPVTGAHAAAASVAEAAPSIAPVAASPAPASPVPAERRLSWLGGLLALVLLVALIGIIYFAMSATPALAPGVVATPATAPVATAQPTAAPTSRPTAGPTSAATAAPTSGPTAGPTSAATAAATAAPTSAATAAATAGPTTPAN
jgi:protein phosphatase